MFYIKENWSTFYILPTIVFSDTSKCTSLEFIWLFFTVGVKDES